MTILLVMDSLPPKSLRDIFMACVKLSSLLSPTCSEWSLFRFQAFRSEHLLEKSSRQYCRPSGKQFPSAPPGTSYPTMVQFTWSPPNLCRGQLLIWAKIFKPKCKFLAVNCVEKLLSLSRKHCQITAATLCILQNLE